MALGTNRNHLGYSRCPRRLVLVVTGLLGAASLSGCGTADGSAVLGVEIVGIRMDASMLDIKLYRADCFGTHPCDTWLAQTAIAQYSRDPLSYALSLPPAVSDLSIYLRVETTETASACVGARATASAAKLGAEYAGATVTLALDTDAVGPPFVITMPNVCPFSYESQGAGTGTVTLSWAGATAISDPKLYPDELPRTTLVTASATPTGGSHFTMWASPSDCAGQTQSTCSFYLNEQVRLIPVFAGP